MKKFIIKSNEWYDNLKEPKRTLFFVVVVLGSLVFTQYLMYAKNFVWAFPIWALVLLSWRYSYTIIKNLLVILSVTTLSCNGQGSWNILNVKYNFNSKFSLFAEGQIRSLKFYDHFHYHEYKGGFNYKANPSLILTLAAGHYDTYKEGGNFIRPKNNDEFRVWPQIALNQSIGPIKIEQRYRAEFRFTNSYHQRLRYRLGLSYPFGKEKDGYRPFQLSVTDEIFFGDAIPFFQRNRLWAYFNYRVSKQVYLQTGYVYQIDYKVNDETGRDFFQIGIYVELSKKG